MQRCRGRVYRRNRQRNADVVQEIFNKLSETYTMTFQDNATEHLRYTITRNEQEKTISLSQKGSVLKLLDLYLQNHFQKHLILLFLERQ